MAAATQEREAERRSTAAPVRCDVGDVAAAGRPVAPTVTMAITDVDVRREGPGRHRIESTIELTNDGDGPSDHQLVGVQVGSTPQWEFIAHSPVPAAPLGPGESTAVTVTGLVLDIDEAPRTHLRAVVVGRPGSARTARFASTEVALEPTAADARLSVAELGGVEAEGARRTLRLRVSSTDTAVDARSAVIQLRSDGRWLPARHWRVESGDRSVVTGALSWHTEQAGSPVEVRALAVTSDADVAASTPVVVWSGTHEAMQQTILAADLILNDSRPVDEGHELLCVVTLHNEGTVDLADLSPTFEQRQPTSAAWFSVPHVQRVTPLAIVAGGSLAVPVLVQVDEADSGLVLLRCTVDSATEALTTQRSSWTVFAP